MFDELGETVTIERSSAANNRGDRTRSTVELDGVLFDTQSSGEDRQRRDAAVSTVRIFVPFGSDVRTGDVIVRADGARFHVDGEPYQHEHGWDLGMEVPAVRRRG